MKKRLLLLLSALAVFTAQPVLSQATFTYDASSGSDLQKGSYSTLTLQNRPLPSGEWVFFCLPFDATKTQLDAAFGEGGYELQAFDAMDGTTLVFKQMSEPSMTAGLPYLVKNTTGEDVSTLTFHDVTVSVASNSETTAVGSASVVLSPAVTAIASWQYLNDGKTHFQLINGVLTQLQWGMDTENNIKGTQCKIDVSDGSVPLISIEGNSQGGGGGGSLSSKIANREQLTDVPTIYLTIPDVTDIDQDLYKDRSTNHADYHRATIQVVDNSEAGSPQHLESFIDDELKVKVRGNSTADPSKRPYRLKFTKKEKAADGLPHKHDLLGLGYTKRNWTLLANHFDRSMMRNALTYHLGRHIGLDFCPGYKFVDLVINNDYRGTYQVSDHVEADKDRVNVDDDKTDWMLETVSWTSMMEEPCLNAGAFEGHYVPLMTNIKNPDTEDWTTDTIYELKKQVAAWEETWHSAFQNSSRRTGWPAWNDMASLVKFYIGINLTADYDGFFVMKGWCPPSGMFHWGPLWDKDLAFDNCSYASATKMVEEYTNGQFRWNFINYLQKDITFVTKAKELMDRLVADNLYGQMVEHIDNIADTLAQTQALNYERWPIKGDIGIGTQLYDTHAEHVQQLKDFLQARITFVKSTIDGWYEELVSNKMEGEYNPDNVWWGTGTYELKNRLANIRVLNRTLKGGEWNTLCLPFDATQAQMEEALGCTYELRTHTAMDSDGTTMLFEPTATADVEAALPYLIKPAEDVSSMYFQDVVLVADASQQTSYNGELITFDNEHYFGGSLFTGYNLSTSTDYLFLADLYADDSSLALSTTDHQAGCRAFIRVSNGEVPVIAFSAANTAIATGLTGGERVSPVHNQIFTLAGIPVGTDSGHLPKGVYIRNGRKIVVR